MTTESGAYIREHFFGPDPRLRALVAHLTDEELQALPRGGHDYRKLYAAYKAGRREHRRADSHPRQDHQGLEARARDRGAQRHPPDQEDDPRPAARAARPAEAGEPDPRRRPRQRQAALLSGPSRDRPSTSTSWRGGTSWADRCPHRVVRARARPARPGRRGASPSSTPARGTRQVSTTMAFARLLRNLMRDKDVGRLVVPIIPDEARTFGMDALVLRDEDLLAQGPALQVGRRRAAHALRRGGRRPDPGGGDHRGRRRWRVSRPPGPPTRRGRSRWCRSTSSTRCSASSGSATSSGSSPTRGRGFLIGCTAGRTTLNGEGLQHEDGHSPPARLDGAERARLRPGLRLRGRRDRARTASDAMYGPNARGRLLLPHPIQRELRDAPLPDAEEGGGSRGHLRGLYRYSEPAACEPAGPGGADRHAGDDPVLRLGLAGGASAPGACSPTDGTSSAETWWATSYKTLREDALEVERWNRLHPAETPRTPYVTEALATARGRSSPSRTS